VKPQVGSIKSSLSLTTQRQRKYSLKLEWRSVERIHQPSDQQSLLVQSTISKIKLTLCCHSPAERYSDT